MIKKSLTAPSGNLGLSIVRNGTVVEPAKPISKGLSLGEIAALGMPQKGLPESINEWRTRNFKNLFRGVRRRQLAKALHLPDAYGALYLRVFRANGQIDDLGLASLRVVTTAGVAFIVNAFLNTTELENMKFHALGTGVAAEASSDSALGTELTTQYNPDGTRATGTTTTAAANIYRTVATNTVDGAAAVTEHGIFSQAAVGGVLLDRSVFAVVNLAIGDSLQTTYDLTFPAGG